MSAGAGGAVQWGMATKTTPPSTAPGYVYKVIASPVGELTLVGSTRGLAAILWKDDNPKRVRLNIVGKDDNLPILCRRSCTNILLANEKSLASRSTLLVPTFKKKYGWHC
jgi:hypothetical protein